MIIQNEIKKKIIAKNIRKFAWNVVSNKNAKMWRGRTKQTN